MIDGQGGGIGGVIVKALRGRFCPGLEVWALGANALDTSMMIKAGANRGAGGENFIVRGVALADFVVGPLGIVLADSMMGEMPPRAAHAAASCPARKLLLPLSQEKVEVIGVAREPLPHLVEELMGERSRRYLEDVRGRGFNRAS